MITIPCGPFLVFGGDTYYAQGGWCDLIATAESIKGAQAIIREAKQDEDIEWWQIIDAGTMTVIEAAGQAHGGYNPHLMPRGYDPK